MTELIEKHIEETDCTSLEMAAALLKLSMGEFATEVAFDTGLDMSEGEGKAARARLFVNVGKRDRIRPGDIVGAIAGESGMPGQLVGSIQMYDNYTFVEVPVDYADAVLEAMQNVKIRGRNIQIERANSSGKSGGRGGRRNEGDSEGRSGRSRGKSGDRGAERSAGRGNSKKRTDGDAAATEMFGEESVGAGERTERKGGNERTSERKRSGKSSEAGGKNGKSTGKKRARGKLGVVDVSQTGRAVRKKK
jgi:hypothetical protein